MIRGLVGHIGRHALHDGPGIRSVVFLKGCPLRCPWCHNPELLAPRPEVVFRAHLCIGCGECVPTCPTSAVDPDLPGRVVRARCDGCGRCAETCPAGALELSGRWMTAEALVEEVIRDRVFYEVSGGGVTFSGGEPTAQLEFLGAAVARLKEEGVHVALETNGVFPWNTFAQEVLDRVDLFLFDLKLADPEEHRRWTGVGNAVVFYNLTRLVALRAGDLVVRVPLVPRFTAREENLIALAGRMREAGVRRCSLLPYHPFGCSKAETIGKTPDAAVPVRSMNPAEATHWGRHFEEFEHLGP